MIQSNYIPWRGYFDFIASVDVFLFYDDVIYGCGKKWRNRNQIKTRTGRQWLTVPLEAHHSGKLIKDVRISYNNDWVARHTALLRENYFRAPYYAKYAPIFASILRSGFERLSDLNVALCRWVCRELAITTPIRPSFAFGVGGDKYHRPVDLACALGASVYLTGPNTLHYTDARLFASRGLSLEVKSYDYCDYPQQWGPFQGNVSVIDLLFNMGPQARAYIASASPNRVII